MGRKYFQLQTTVDDRARADEIVNRALNERLAACGQILGPVDSTYWWNGKRECQSEWLCVFKTTESLLGRLRDLVEDIHPYQTPEIVAFEMDVVANGFSDWIDDETHE